MPLTLSQLAADHAEEGMQQYLWTMNFGPPAWVTTAGTPDANASRTTLPNVSVREGNANTSMFA